MFASKDTLLTRPSGYNIARSVRLRSSATAYFNRTQTSGNRKTYTYSAWVKRGNLTTKQNLFGSLTYVPPPQNDQSYWSFLADNTFEIALYSSSAYLGQLITTQVFRDPSAWYHIVVQVDTTQATSSNRLKLYVNGTQITSFSTTNYPTQNTDTFINANGYGVGIGRTFPFDTSEYFDGYQTEINFIDGQALTPSSFGETDSITGVWKPKAYSGTYGTNGFELNFSDNSNNTAATIGKDYSGNGNNWTPNNISVTAGATYDSMTDVPTLTSATAANYATWNPLVPSLSTDLYGGINGNLSSTGSPRFVSSTIGMSSGKWYFEVTMGFNDVTVGIWLPPFVSSSSASSQTNYRYYGVNGTIYTQAGATGTTYSTYTTGDVISVALDMDNGKLYFGKNGTWQGSANPVTGTNPTATGLTGTWVFGVNQGANYTHSANFGQQGFVYTPPTGFVALNTYNLPASTITNGAAYMAATTYTGTGSARSVTGVGFQPDFVWIKERSSTSGHALFDVVRGVQKRLVSNTTDAEDTSAQLLTAFNSDGFSVGTDGAINENTQTYIGWQWKANGTGVTNTNGTITSTVSAGATQGFSVVTYTGSGSAATVGHGLGVAPSFVIVKFRTEVENWYCYHASIGNTKAILLNTTGAATGASANYWNNTTPTSSVVSLGGTTSAPYTYVMYAFAAVAGYSAFGSYTGNGSADGPFVYTGFRPRWVMWKNSSTGGTDWTIIDSSRNTYNVANSGLQPNGSYAEASNSNYQIDFLSNGFKLRTTNAEANQSGISIIYAAFAENPFRNALAR